MKKLLVIQVAALGYELLRRNDAPRVQGLEFAPAQSVLPALTCVAQATFRTGLPPAAHGMVANGLFARHLGRVMFWEQSAGLVAGERIWDGFRARGGRVGLMFWQQSLGETADLVLSPAPIHKHHGGMIQDCYSQPAGLYERLCGEIGPFRLHHYWGPLASAKVGDWIAAATAEVLADRMLAPELLLTYLPSLDYDLQRFGPDHAKGRLALRRTLDQLAVMLAAARQEGYEVLVFGDYAIAEVSAALYPNRVLVEAGLLATRNVRGMSYPDLHTSRAFAMVDHEVAHVYVRCPADIPRVREALGALGGACELLDRPQQAARGIAHPNSGELVLLAGQGHWLAYPWWSDRRQRPEYATHVDIHSKPGYDPCELFFGWPPPSVSQDASRIRGSHGRTGPGREIAFAATWPVATVENLLDLAKTARDFLQ